MIKLLSLALAAFVATSTMASAQASAAMSQGMIFSGDGEDDSNVMRVEFNRVDASDAGVIEVYTYPNGEVGELIATRDVDAGTNWRINIPLGRNIQDTVIAQLKIDGEVVDQRIVGERY